MSLMTKGKLSFGGGLPKIVTKLSSSNERLATMGNEGKTMRMIAMVRVVCFFLVLRFLPISLSSCQWFNWVRIADSASFRAYFLQPKY